MYATTNCGELYCPGVGLPRGGEGGCGPSEMSEDRVIRFNLVSEYHNIVINTCSSTPV